MRVQEMAQIVENDPALKAQMQADPAGTMKTLAAMPLQSDVWIYRFVVLALGAAVLISVTGGTTLAFYEKPTPEILIAIGSAAVGALAGLLAPSPSR